MVLITAKLTIHPTEGKDLARQFGCKFIETSAKARINVEEAFYTLVREIRRFTKDSPNKKKGKKRCVVM